MNVEGVAALDGDGATQVILTGQGRCLLAERVHRLRAALDDREGDAASTLTTSGRSPNCAAFAGWWTTPSSSRTCPTTQLWSS